VTVAGPWPRSSFRWVPCTNSAWPGARRQCCWTPEQGSHKSDFESGIAFCKTGMLVFFENCQCWRYPDWQMSDFVCKRSVGSLLRGPILKLDTKLIQCNLSVRSRHVSFWRIFLSAKVVRLLRPPRDWSYRRGHSHVDPRWWR
jgi:hypothetical protein